MAAHDFDRLHPLEKIIQDGLCMGCGFCVASLQIIHSKVKAEMRFDPQQDCFVPKIQKWTSNDEPVHFICPGINMDMVWLTKKVHGRIPEDPIIGIYKSLRVCWSTDDNIGKRASSGGVIPAILTHLFATERIDVAYCVQPGDGPYDAKGSILRSVEELNKIHGSVYHPVNFGVELYSLINGSARFAFVGLPCQIAGLEMLKARDPGLERRHVLSLGLFCGGINRFEGISYYLQSFKIPWNNVEKISYREGAWPGKIRVVLRSTGKNVLVPRIRENTRWKILRYVIAFQGYWMLKRCRICPDQVSDFADIAVGDPHLQEYRSRGGAGFSITITRTDRGEELLKRMITFNELGEENIDRDAVVASQGYTIDNRRHVPVYMRISRLFGGQTPNITVYPDIYKTIGVQHYVYAVVDLLKVVLPKNKLIRAFYIPWQIFEYLFITFTPFLITKRLVKILRNK